MQNLSNKNVVITGASSGIGQCLAVQLAALGCNLALSDINQQGLAHTKVLLAASAVKIRMDRLDVTDRQAFSDYAQAILADFGHVDIVINNAGVAASGEVKDCDYDIYEWVFNINVWGVLHGTKAFLPSMLANGSGKIVNISSIFGLISLPTFSAYNMSKFAVRGLNEALWSELDGTNVSCLSVHPGGIKTNLLVGSKAAGESGTQMINNFEKMFATSADECARQIIKGIRKDKCRVVIGADAHLFSFLQRLMPGRYFKTAMKLMKWKLG